MTDEHLDERSWRQLKDLWETPVGRRWVLKAGLGSAVALGAELYAGPALAAARRTKAVVRPADLHFRLGSVPGVSDLVLVANGARMPLQRHTRTTHAALRRSAGVWRAADLSALTHHVSGLELPGDRALLMTVVGRRGDQTVVVAQTWHVPAQVTLELARTTHRLTGSMKAAIGSDQRLRALNLDPREVCLPDDVASLGTVCGSDDAAFSLVSVHPNVATVAPAQHKITEIVVTGTKELGALATHIATMQEAGRDYGRLQTAQDSNGKDVELTFPAVKDRPEVKSTFTTFELSDDDQFKRRLKSAVKTGISTVRDDGRLGAVIAKPLDDRPRNVLRGRDKPGNDREPTSTATWIQPEGVAPQPIAYKPALKGTAIDVKVKNTGLNFGTYVTVNGDYAKGKVPLKLYNNYVRWVSVYVQYLGKDEKNLSVDPGAKFPNTQYSKSLGLMPQVFTVLGIPLWDTNTLEVELDFPPGSHVARVLMCGLGADIHGNGWRQYFPDDAYPGKVAPTYEVLVPSILTGVVTIGLNVFALATDLEIAAVWQQIRKNRLLQEKDSAELFFNLLEVFKKVAGREFALLASETLAAGIASGLAGYEEAEAGNRDTGNLWELLLGFGSMIPKLLFSPLAGEFFLQVALDLAEFEVAAKIIEALPIIGQVIAVLSVVGDIATLAEVAAETIVSPWVIENEVSLTYPATIEIHPDPKSTGGNTFPKTAKSWRLEGLVEGSLVLDPIINSFNGAAQSDPLKVDVVAPFGGKDIQWSVVMLDGSGRQVASGVSAKQANDDPNNPFKNPKIQITQLPATIDEKTVFRRTATTTYNGAAGGYEWSEDVKVTGTSNRKGVQGVTGTAVATLAGVAGVVFEEGDHFYIRGVPVEPDGKPIELGTSTKEKFARRPFLLLDPFVQENDRRNHVLLEPDEHSDGYQIRRVSLDPRTGSISWDANSSFGTFSLPVSAAALHAPSGKVVVVHTDTGRIGSVQPADTSRPQLASYRAGPGDQVGLLRSPVAVAVTNAGVVLVLESGTRQIAAFDLNGNPVRYFPSQTPGAGLEFRRKLASDGLVLDIAVDGSDQIYVLYTTGDRDTVDDYRIDVYSKQGEVFNRASSGTNVARFAVDYWRSVYGTNYDALTALGTNDKRIDPRLGVAEPSMSRLDPLN
jgi:hypothetical protein